MIFKQIQCGGDRNFGYLVACELSGKAALIDPSPDPELAYLDILEKELKLIYVINTHTHPDHSQGNAFFKNRMTPAVVIHESAGVGDIRVKDQDRLVLGTLELCFFHTPGHTPDSMCVLIETELVTGDTLFVGKVGGTYSREGAEQEFSSLKNLMSLDPAIRVWPGHDYGVRPSSTIREELKSNPFVLRLNQFEDFIWLKEHWLEYKKEHHIQ